MASEILPSSQGIGKCGWGCSLELAQMVKNLPARQETQVRSLSGEDPLEKGMATHSSILAWRIPWMEETGGLHSTGSPRVRHSWASNTFTFTSLPVASVTSEKLYSSGGWVGKCGWGWSLELSYFRSPSPFSGGSAYAWVEPWWHWNWAQC